MFHLRNGLQPSRGWGAVSWYSSLVPKGLKRYYGEGHLHFITCSCERRRPLLGTPARRDLFLRILEQVRRRYRFQVVGYVVMPEHFHLRMSEPEEGDPSLVMQVLKQRVARRLLAGRERARSRAQLRLLPDGRPEGEHFWQRRFYDFNVWSRRKRIEKLRYMAGGPRFPHRSAPEGAPFLRASEGWDEVSLVPPSERIVTE